MEKRNDYGDTADGFFDSLNDIVAPLAQELRAVIRNAIPKASESIKWGMPVYECGIFLSRSFELGDRQVISLPVLTQTPLAKGKSRRQLATQAPFGGATPPAQPAAPR